MGPLKRPHRGPLKGPTGAPLIGPIETPLIGAPLTKTLKQKRKRLLRLEHPGVQCTTLQMAKKSKVVATMKNATSSTNFNVNLDKN